MASMQLRSDYAERRIVPAFIGLTRTFLSKGDDAENGCRAAGSSLQGEEDRQ